MWGSLGVEAMGVMKRMVREINALKALGTFFTNQRISA